MGIFVSKEDARKARSNADDLEPPSPFSNLSPVDTIFILGGNLFVLLGVVLWNWSFFDVFYVYWVENVIIGLIVLIRMLMVAAAWGIGMVIGTVFTAAFFIFHYGLFCLAHGTIMFDIFAPDVGDANAEPGLLLSYMFKVEKSGLFYAVLGMVVVEAVKGWQDRINDKRDAKLPDQIMFSPYGRIVVLHIAILFGGFAAESFGDPLWALVLLVILKSLYDVVAHNINRQAKAGNIGDEGTKGKA